MPRCHAPVSRVGVTLRRPPDFSPEELGAAFDRVQDPRDGDGPILAVIPASDWQLVRAAVVWFTATRPVFWQLTPASSRLVVTAPGRRCGDDPWGFLGPVPGR